MACMEASTTDHGPQEAPADAGAVEADRALIDKLGGPTALARRLSFGIGGAQRVSNWRVRGIPPKVKLQHPDLFLGHLTGEASARA